jgi:hypothetical protein
MFSERVQSPAQQRVIAHDIPEEAPGGVIRKEWNENHRQHAGEALHGRARRGFRIAMSQ